MRGPGAAHLGPPRGAAPLRVQGFRSDDKARLSRQVLEMTGWLSEDERAAWVRLVALTELLPTAFDAQLRRDADLV